jgi:hypothetical protein
MLIISQMKIGRNTKKKIEETKLKIKSNREDYSPEEI